MTEAKRERPFIVRWRSAVLNSTEPASVKLTLLALAEFANVDGTECIPGFTALARMTSQSERTCRRAIESTGARWFMRHGVKLAGKDWRAFRYDLHLPDGADTVSGASKGRCGHLGVKVRTLTTDGADTVSTVLERAPREEHLERAKGNRAPLLTFQEALDQVPEDDRFLPLDDPIFEFVESAGIPGDFHYLAWVAFKQRFKASGDRCADWRERYRRAIREDWFKLWRVDRETNGYVLTTAGEQLSRTI